jgi:flagellar hook-associated protein 3 FlgL
MRISSIQAFNNGVSGLQRNYGSVTRTQEQISSGKRILTPADDPVASVRLMQLRQQESVLAQYKGNLTAAQNSLNQEEATLTSVVNVLQRVRELTVQAGGGALSGEDRKSLAKELQQRENELLSLFNTRNAQGDYLFSGYLGKQQPFVRSPDGTYSYLGDEGQRSLQVATSTTVAVNDNGQRLFEGVPNTNLVENFSGVRNQFLPAGVMPLQYSADPNPANWAIPARPPEQQRVFLSPGLVTDSRKYSEEFRGTDPLNLNEPYSMVLVSGSEFRLYDRLGADVTADTSSGGKFDALASNGNSFEFRGMRFQMDVVLKPGDNQLDLDNLLAGSNVAGSPGIDTHTFTLQSIPMDFALQRSSTNTSTAQITSGVVANQALYNQQFPISGLVLRFTNANDYDVFAQPMDAASVPIGNGSLTGPFPETISLNGAEFAITAFGAAGDEFSIQSRPPQQASILNTIARLRQVLESAPQGAPGNLAIRDEVAIGISNLDSGIGKVLEVQTEIGARLNLIDSTMFDNEDVTLVNKATQADLGELDYAEALSRLSFQTIVLEAAQQSYVKVAGLNLFNFLR